MLRGQGVPAGGGLGACLLTARDAQGHEGVGGRSRAAFRLTPGGQG